MKSDQRKTKSPPIDWARKNAVPLKFDTKPAFATVFAPFCDNCQPKLASEVIPSAAVEQVGRPMFVYSLVIDSRSSRS